MRSDKKTMFDAPKEILDASDKNFLSAIEEFGWTTSWIYPEEDKPGYSFSTGFDYSLGEPEVVIFALPNEFMNMINWSIWKRLQEGSSIPVGQRVPEIIGNDLDVVFLPMAPEFYEEYLGMSRWFYLSDSFQVLVMYWPDKRGVFPWEPGFDPKFSGLQPDLSPDGWKAQTDL